MSELMSPMDVVQKRFEKRMRGYDTAEVDDFLDQVAENLQEHLQHIKDLEDKLKEQTDKLEEFDRIKGSLHEALLMAQRTAEEKVHNAERASESKIRDANAKAEDILAEARLAAARIREEAEERAGVLGDEITKLEELRAECISHLRSFIAEIGTTVDRAESDGSIELPSFTLGIMHRRAESMPAAARPADGPMLVEHHQAEMLNWRQDGETEEPKADLSDTLTALGIDPELLKPDI